MKSRGRKFFSLGSTNVTKVGSVKIWSCLNSMLESRLLLLRGASDGFASYSFCLNETDETERCPSKRVSLLPDIGYYLIFLLIIELN